MQLGTPTRNVVMQRIDELRAILFMHWVLVVSIVGGSLVVALAGSLLVTPLYRSQAILHISPVWGQEFKVEQVLNEELNRIRNTRQFYRTQMEIMVSRPVMDRVTERFLEAYPEAGVDRGDIKEALSITPVPSSELLDVSFMWPEPDQAASLANLVCEVYSDQNLEARRSASREAQHYLAKRLVEFEARIEDASTEVLDYQLEHDLADVEEDITELSSRMRALSEAKGTMTTDRVLLEATVVAHGAQLARRSYAELSNDIDTPLIHDYNRELAKAETEHARVVAQYGPQHPTYLASASLVEKLEQALRTQVEEVLATERARLETLRQKETDLQIAIDEAKQQLLKRQALTADYEKLHMELKQAREFHEALRTRDHELELAAQTQLNNIRIVETAQPAGRPIKPNWMMNFVIALITGLLAGVAAAFIRYYSDDRLASPAEIVTFLRVPYLGMVPEVTGEPASKERALYSYQRPRSSVAEAIRAIRTLIEHESGQAGQPRRLLLVTSAVASEGKTESAVRLGIAYADLGRRVVVVDADLRRARLHKLFDEPRGKGLADVLKGEATIQESVRPTEVPGVFLLPAGSSVERPNELLATVPREDLLARLLAEFDMVILDTPPASFLSDSLLLAPLVDGVVMVVRDGAVSRRLVLDTVDRLKQVEAPMAGVIVNAVQTGPGSARYNYYYYGYGYGGYGYGYSNYIENEKAKDS